MWLAYLARRLLGVLALAGALVVLTFLLVQAVPGDPARNIVGIGGSPEQLATVRRQLGLDRPILEQFQAYMSGLLRGDLGHSFVTGQPVSQMLGDRLPVTIVLASLSLIVVMVVGFSTGMTIAAVQDRSRGRKIDLPFTIGTSLVGATPGYITALVLVLIFPLWLGWLPVQGGESADGMILPTLALAVGPAAVVARLVRNEATSILREEYVVAAISKRLPAWRLYLVHVAPNVLTSTLTLGGLILVSMLGSAVVVESVFNIAGIGGAAVQAVQQSDYPAIQGVVLALGLCAIAISLAIDIVLGILDPRTLTRTRPN